MLRRLAPVVALMLALFAVACGSDDEGSGGSSGGKGGAEIKIGASLPLTGEFSEPGKAAQQGYKVWEAMTNEKGGLIDGRKVKFVIRDDAGTSEILFKTSDSTWQAYNAYGGIIL